MARWRIGTLGLEGGLSVSTGSALCVVLFPDWSAFWLGQSAGAHSSEFGTWCCR